MSRFFTAGGQSIGASASASVLPMSSSLSSSHKSQGSRQRYDLPSRKYLEAGVRDRESADLLPCYLYPKEYFNKPSMCVSLDAYSSCLCLKISKKASFTKSPGAFLKVSCLELSSGVAQSAWMWVLRVVSRGCSWWSSGSGSAFQCRGHGFNPYSGT